MNLMHEDLARAQMSERLGEAQDATRAPARHRPRLSRRAERAADRRDSRSPARSEPSP